MKRILTIIAVVGFLSTATAAMAVVEVDNADDAILYTNGLNTTNDKTTYLMTQGKKFMEEGKYLEAKQTADYVLANLDRNNFEARELKREARAKVDENTIPRVNPLEISF